VLKSRLKMKMSVKVKVRLMSHLPYHGVEPA